MNQDEIKSWLQRKKGRSSTQQVLFGVLGLLAGVSVLFLTFWFAYAVIWIGEMGVSALSDLVAGRRLHMTHEVRLICSGVFLVLLFVQHYRTRPDYWGQYPDRAYVTGPALPVAGGMIGSLGIMLAYPGASANMIADILLSGPRLVTGSWGCFGRARTLRQLDENGCAQLLAFLYGRIHTVPYEELKSAGWEAWFDQLRNIEGVQFLQKGLVLSEELRKELQRQNRN